ncbi:B3 domain-containing protein REM16-like isoform X1 [Tripterygium wilfordii]|uniref:B3 domain-containing protein REM16-like isoform X1 n=1 Tax=Tripterygium wilfordii TaxID=458696 RepID=A0A7J7D302_TRIWF|nr:B3 domain-containing protein REM16-like [Tripterygium wilfordii]KAF5740725.1 B3 domain-containing protein REM16-like isoform X1 [Tripterygium wilfordii]
MDESHETCKDCRSGIEDLYWTHFQCHQFSQFLRAGFDQCLAIPEPFTRNLKSKLPETVNLKGPSGITWNVGLTTNNNITFLSHGWKDFVRDHVLEENDVLIFKYNGDSCFDVLMFDGRSLCEKASSYFVRNCMRHKHDSGCQKQSQIRGGSSSEIVPPLPQDAVRDSLKRKLIFEDGDERPSGQSGPQASDTIPVGRPLVFQATNNGLLKKSRTKRKIPESSNEQVSIGGGSSPHNSIGEDTDEKPAVPTYASIRKKASYHQQYQSNRRPVTEEEKRKALRLADAELTPQGFLSVMKQTSIYRKHYLGIPSWWMNKHLSLKNQDLILRVNEDTWQVTFRYVYSRGHGGLSTGWKNFALDNKLDEFDVCVFEPSSPLNNCVVLDVKIFRVVPEVQPLTPVKVASL